MINTPLARILSGNGMLYKGNSGGGGGATMSPADMNLMARRMVIQNSINMTQQIFTTTLSTNIPGSVINVPLRPVGLVKRLWVKTVMTVQSQGTVLTLTSFGPSNIFSNVTFTDLSNQTRINTTGWHLGMIASAKRRRVFGAAFTSDTPMGFGNNFTGVISAPATINSNPVVNNVFMFHEVPLAYNDQDLRGSIFANVTNATLQLQLTVNPNFFAATGVDATNSVYGSSGSATTPQILSMTVTVYQNYLDQLPHDQKGNTILPLIDLSIAYLLNQTPISALVATQDIPVQYANFRDFMSTIVVYDNAGTLNVGSDVSFFALQSANYTNIFKMDPNTVAMLTRLILGDDFPRGTYYFDHREKPISTIQYGNMQLVANLLTVGGSSAALLVAYESLAFINMITQAGSLYGN